MPIWGVDSNLSPDADLSLSHIYFSFGSLMWILMPVNFANLIQRWNAWYCVLQCICIHIWHSLCSVDRCLSFCTFSIGHCAVYPSSVDGFRLVLWYIQTILMYFPKVKREVHVQSKRSYVTFEVNIEIGSHKTGGHLIQV